MVRKASDRAEKAGGKGRENSPRKRVLRSPAGAKKENIVEPLSTKETIVITEPAVGDGREGGGKFKVSVFQYVILVGILQLWFEVRIVCCYGCIIAVIHDVYKCGCVGCFCYGEMAMIFCGYYSLICLCVCYYSCVIVVILEVYVNEFCEYFFFF